MNLTDAEKAYNAIKDQIIQLQLEPGSVITETQLMDHLGIGRTPIREALKRLQAENLVVLSPRRGMFISDIAITDLIQLYEMRLELEPLCARLAAQRIKPDQLVQLRALADEFKQHIPTEKKQLITLDCRFHSLLAEASQNKFLKNELEHLHNLSMRIWNLALDSAASEEVNVEAHLDILSAIEAGDPRLAEETMLQHIQRFHQNIKRYF